MARYLKQNTATTIVVGPFYDATDGKTPEVALTATNEKLTMVVDNAGSPVLAIDANATASGGSNDFVHVTNDDGGYYTLELAAANVNYVGGAVLSITYATDHLPVFHEFNILPAQVYDSMISGTDLLDANVAQVAGSSVTTLTGAYPSLGIVDSGTAQGAADSTHIQLRSAAAFADGELVGTTVVITGGTTGVGQARIITDYTGSTDTATVDTWTTTPTGTITYIVFATPKASTTLLPAVNVTQWLGTACAAPTVSGVPEVDITHIAGSAVNTASAQLGVNMVSTASGAITATSIATDAIGSDEISAAAVTKIQAGLATAAALTTVDDFLDTEIAAIKAVTDQMVFTKASELDVNVQSINGATVIGDGNATPWDGA